MDRRTTLIVLLAAVVEETDAARREGTETRRAEGRDSTPRRRPMTLTDSLFYIPGSPTPVPPPPRR
jgi:hypothetical protein